MLHKRYGNAGIGLLGIGLLTFGLATRADEVTLAKFAPTTASAAHGSVENKLTLTAEKPAGITREPVYRYKPKYGTLKIGDAKNNEVYVVLDAPEDNKTVPTLYVDGNGNGDLTDDPKIVLSVVPVPKASVKTASDTRPKDGKKDDKTKPDEKKDAKPEEKKKPAFAALVPIIVRYNMTGPGSVIPGNLRFIVREGEVSYTSDITRTGTLKIGTRTFRAALVDQSGTGLFNNYDHEDDQPVRVSLMIDRNEDGVFNPKKETFDAGSPFRFGSGSYEVKSIDTRGLIITVGQAGRKVKAPITASELKVGSEVIDFESKTVEGKSVSFPDDYKGRLVILDIWGPIKETADENANLKAVYERYHEKGLEVLGALPIQGAKNEDIKTLLQQMGITWAQIYEGPDSGIDIADLYQPRRFPYRILVNGKTGKILAMDSTLHGDALETTVAKAIEDMTKEAAP